MKKTKTFNQSITEAMNKYDGTNYIYNAADDGIYTEQELKKKFTAQDNYKLLKSVANNQEKKQFRDIERKYKKKNPSEPRREPFSKKPDTGAAVKIDIAPFPFENTITHTYGAIENVPVEEVKPRRSKRKLEGLPYILGVSDD